MHTFETAVKGIPDITDRPAFCRVMRAAMNLRQPAQAPMTRRARAGRYSAYNSIQTGTMNRAISQAEKCPCGRYGDYSWPAKHGSKRFCRSCKPF